MQIDKPQNFATRVLAGIERAGNALPHPAILFLLSTAIILVISALVSWLGASAVHPLTQAPIAPVNLLSVVGLHLMISDMVKNFAGFAPLGSVLVAMLGFSLAEKSGLLSALIRSVVLRSPRALLTPAVLVAGILSHTAGDIGYVLLIPLAAMAFHSAGLNPLAGLAICFAGVSGGYAANFLVSAVDPLLAGLTQEASRIVDPGYTVNPLVNYYFMAVSSLLIVGAGTLIANKVTIPFLGPYRGDVQDPVLERLTSLEKRGLRNAGLVALGLALVLLAGLIPEDGFLRDPNSHDVLHSPVLKGVVAVIFIFASLTGLAYGLTLKTFKDTNDVVKAMQESMATMAPYLVLVFFAAQFISLFNASNIGLILAVHGSVMFKTAGIGPIPLMIGFILFTCVLDIFIGSASAKWALMAPVFVPMFMLLGISPELTQASYRIADSVINIVSPLMSYFPLILAFAAKYDPKARVGTVIALMLPYSLGFLVLWSLMLFVWISLGWPLGPGAGLVYPPVSR